MESQFPNPSLGTLSRLPLEIRDMIYSFVLAADPVITRISKALHRETQPLLRQHGICRVTFEYHGTAVTRGPPIAFFTDTYWNRDFSHRTFCPKTPLEDLARVSNVKVNVKMVEPHEIPCKNVGPLFPWMLGTFALWEGIKHCHLVFTMANKYGVSPAYNFRIGGWLCFIQKFELVTIELRERPRVHGNSDFHDRKGNFLDDVYGVRVLGQKLFDAGRVEKNGAGPRVKIIEGAAGGSDGKVLWDSQAAVHVETHADDLMGE